MTMQLEGTRWECDAETSIYLEILDDMALTCSHKIRLLRGELRKEVGMLMFKRRYLTNMNSLHLYAMTVSGYKVEFGSCIVTHSSNIWFPKLFF